MSKNRRVGKLTFTAEAIETGYWIPGDNYLEKIAASVDGKISDGDILVISEKAISVAKGLIVDESKIKPGLLARFLARIWMRIFWGYFLGQLCHMRKVNVERLRRYPLNEGAAHKETALRYAGLLHALMWGSEGGIDGSNLPYAYVSLPLENPQSVAEEIREYLRKRLEKKVIVMIVDTDKTYSLGNFHFTHRPNPMRGIRTLPGVTAYIIGRVLKLKQRPTPLALAGAEMSVSLALEIAKIAEKKRGFGAGRTVWDMAERFHVNITEVSWDMLKKLKHKPIVIVKICKLGHQEKK